MGIRFVAEVRHRAADDATLPTAGPLDRQARPESGSDSFSMVQAGNAWKLNEVAHVPGVGTWRRQYRHARKGQRIPGHAMVYVQYGCGSSAPEGWLNFDASLKERLGIRGKCFLARCAMATLYEGCRLRWHRQSCLRVLYSRTPDRADFEMPSPPKACRDFTVFFVESFSVRFQSDGDRVVCFGYKGSRGAVD